MNIMPVDRAGPYRTGTLDLVTPADIEKVLGFPPNIEDDPDKVKYSWGFEADGKFAAIWDYKGSHKLRVWSTYDPDGIIATLFNRSTDDDEE